MKKFIAIIAILTIGISTSQAQNKKPAAGKEHIVEITTEFGTIKIKLYNETPKHRDNFIKLASEGFYNDLLFHRIISGFMIQGGDPESKGAAPEKRLGSGDVGYKVPAEFNDSLYHKKGALCAARDGNAEKASSGCQFYIVQGKTFTDEELNAMEARSGVKYSAKQREDYKILGGTPQLDKNYTVYGEVIEGLDVLDKIAAVKTQPGDRPVTDVKMTVKVIN
ncbi:MAG: peptidylprolyl isomerase [Bacteroidota bacterium]|nr:peptidylprolyl isomerase [Bacteroidota bacterium]